MSHAQRALSKIIDERLLLTAKILIVDDQKPNILLLEKILASAKYRNVTSTTDPLVVQDLYRQQSFDLVLLDIRMPKLDGFGVMEQLQEVAGDDYVAVLVLTAQTDEETRLRALESGATDFVTKPFSRHEVLSRIRNILEIRLLHNQVKEQKRELERRVIERTEEVVETRLEIVRRLGRAAEFRDNETGLHILRMSNYSYLLAQALEIDAARSELILHASPMHDIGKIGIPDQVLLKPARLNESEWRVMQTHTTIGGELLAGHSSPLMQLASEIALSHHEKWDGTGYPRGLKGEAIPLESRIVAIADVFDALTSTRPYKKAWTVDEALDEIKKNRGQHFQPELVDRFLCILPSVLEVHHRYSEA